MKIQFNEAQLSRPQQQSLIEVLDVLQSENENELVVTPVEFPIKLKVKLDDDIEMLLGWDAGKKSYAGIIKSESPNEPKADAIKPFELPESKKDTVDLPSGESLTDDKSAIQEPELDLSPVIVRAEVLARALVNLSKPLNTEQRIEVWIRFCVILSKELWK